MGNYFLDRQYTRRYVDTVEYLHYSAYSISTVQYSTVSVSLNCSQLSLCSWFSSDLKTISKNHKLLCVQEVVTLYMQ